MLRYVLFDVNFFDDEFDRANSQKRVLCLLEALTCCNQIYLRNNPNTPLIYQSDIVYKVPQQFDKDVSEIGVLRQFLESHHAPPTVREALEVLDRKVGGEVFREIPRIIENGGGDCDNVAAWRVAELRELGIRADPYITWRRRPDGGMTYHVIVYWPDGTSEDPSLLLGMGGEARAADRAEEERKLGERAGEFVKGLTMTRKVRTALGYMTRPRAATSVNGVITPQDFNQLQYTIPFQTDESYADWSPTRPQAFFTDPRYPQGGIPSGTQFFNTRMRDPDDIDDIDIDGEIGARARRLLARVRQAA